MNKPPDLNRQLLKYEQKVQRYSAEQQEKERRRQKDRARYRRIREAAAKLEAAGLRPHLDFAVNLTAEDRVAELLEEVDGQWRLKNGRHP